MQMTEGEKIIWAAVFVKECDTKFAPPHLRLPKQRKEREEWARGVAVSAIETTCYGVRMLRGVEPDVVEGFGEDSDVVAMLREMIGAMARTRLKDIHIPRREKGASK